MGEAPLRVGRKVEVAGRDRGSSAVMTHHFCPSHSSRSQRLDFAGFVRILAHFRPVDEEDPGMRDPKQPEPLNSRMNKLRCEFLAPARRRTQSYPLARRGSGKHPLPWGAWEWPLHNSPNRLPMPHPVHSLLSCISALRLGPRWEDLQARDVAGGKNARAEMCCVRGGEV